ncbi:MAG TPA: type II secretion system protein, partial [Pirellulales bacterium]|nr:type II secretion system protein [Pirellulales bacterium]
MACYRRAHGSRQGFTLVEALVGLAVILVLGLISIPIIFRIMERFRSKTCEYNLHKIGQALENYRSTFQGRYPIGSQYQHNPPSAFGKTWWLDVLRYTDYEQVDKSWANNIPDSGYFNGSAGNQNIKLIDGLRPEIMFCPSSELPHGNDPLTAISAATRQVLGRDPQGIAVPMYAAVSGSAPDMKGLSLESSVSGPRGRNTKEG